MATRRRLLIDTGALVAWFDADDGHHATVRAYLSSFEGELLSTWPVLTETSHLLPEHTVAAFLRWVGAGGVTVVDLPVPAIAGLADRIDKYADLPMDLADASLIWLADTLGVMDIATLDRRDFGVYRSARGRMLHNVFDAPVPVPTVKRRAASRKR